MLAKVRIVHPMILIALLAFSAESLAQAPRTTRFAALLSDLAEQNPASFYLDRGEGLDLTADQVTRLEVINRDLAASADELIAGMDSQRSEGVSGREFRKTLLALRRELRSATEAVHEVLTEEQLKRARAIHASPR